MEALTESATQRIRQGVDRALVKSPQNQILLDLRQALITIDALRADHARCTADGQRMARYLDEAEQATERAEAQVAAATKLVRELRGIFGYAERAIRDAIGNTNAQCLRERMEQFEALLAAPPETP